MNQVPLEIVVIIFSKATLKTLIQCRRVCKSWLAALSDPAILRSSLKLPKCLLLHINPDDTCSSTNSNSNSRFLYLYDHRNIPSPDNALLKLAAKPDLGTTELVGHCNGLLCWCHKVPAGEANQFRVTIYISNPLTGESMTIPAGTDTIRPRRRYSKWSVPARKQCRIGFGFVPHKKQYKLVHLVSKSHRSDELEAKVQTLGSGTWKCVKCPYEVHSKFGEYANGALHWTDADHKIRFFDLERELFGTLPSPPTDGPHSQGGMIVIKDRITVWCGGCSHHDWGVRTWMMMEYGVESSWVELKGRDVDMKLGRSHWNPKLEYEGPLIFYPKKKSLTLRT